MDKNIAALMRQDCRTVKVKFWKDKEYNQSQSSGALSGLALGSLPADDLGAKRYTYVTDLNLKEGDWAIVLVLGNPKVVQVVEVDEGCEIEPNDSTQYKWIFGKVDSTNYFENQKKNDEISDIVSSAYKKTLRAQFSQLLIASADAETQARLQNLVAKKEGV